MSRLTTSVELRGFEPLTLYMPCSMVSSDGVALRLVTAFQSCYRVWGGLARSGGIWVRWSLIWSWFCPGDPVNGDSLWQSGAPTTLPP